MEKWKSQKSKELFRAFTLLNNEDEVAKFCRDLMTEAEIDEFSGRFAVAKELAKGTTQRKTSQLTGVSIATVTRVNQWLKKGMGGYKTVLERWRDSI